MMKFYYYKLLSRIDGYKDELQEGFSNLLLVSFFYWAFYHLPMVWHRLSLINQFSNISEPSIIVLYESCLSFLLTILLFSITRLFKYLYFFLIPLFFCFGGASNYYLWKFGKAFDVGVLQDMLSVEWEMTQSYLSIKLCLYIATSLVIAIFLLKQTFNFFREYKRKKYWQFLMILLIATLLIDGFKYGFYKSKTVLQSYMPFSAIYSVGLLIKDYTESQHLKNNKFDIAKQFKSKIVKTGNEPLIVIMVIGESMRGDMFGLNARSKFNNTPTLAQHKNIVSFENAFASSTTTKISLPYMLTRAKQGEWGKAISETSIISVFKSLGFKTHWIGAQGAFGICDNSYGPIVLEADHVTLKSDIRRDSSREFIYDEQLLPYLDRALGDSNNQNAFIVLHMYGSHWRFEERYPEHFRKNMPVCKSKSPSDCTKEELISSYNNTILYSDWVLGEFIKRIEHKNAIMFFASDHGFSLFDDSNIFGNAYMGESMPKEQIDIAMFAWSSNKFIKNYPRNFSKLMMKKEEVVSHDHLFHSLLGCVDVQSEVVEEGLNLCH